MWTDKAASHSSTVTLVCRDKKTMFGPDKMASEYQIKYLYHDLFNVTLACDDRRSNEQTSSSLLLSIMCLFFYIFSNTGATL
jgi:hypothetical protein